MTPSFRRRPIPLLKMKRDENGESWIQTGKQRTVDGKHNKLLKI